jgi:vancomycin resistance protein VanW
MDKFEEDIIKNIYEYQMPKRIAFSRKYPFLKGGILFIRRNMRNIYNIFDIRTNVRQSNNYFHNIIARHQSVLRRKLGESNPYLQERKIINIKQAIKKLNGTILKPNQIFSLWKIIGKPTYKNGYVDGMLLSNGNIVEGVGGGLCQLSNLLYWIFLHTPTLIIERSHHSQDIFPDSGRVLPFGSGATIFYNFIDLKVKNISKYPLQLKIWLTDTHLKSQIMSINDMAEKFHIYEKNHCFVKYKKQYFRYNELYRETKIDGNIIKTEKVTTNFAPVHYKVDEEYIKKNGYNLYDFSNC